MFKLCNKITAILKTVALSVRFAWYTGASTSLAYILRLEKISIWIAKAGVKWTERSCSPVLQSSMYGNLAFVYEILGQWELSLQIVEKENMLSPKGDYRLTVAMLYERLGRIDLALENYRRALTEDNPEKIEEDREFIIEKIKELETFRDKRD